MPLSSTLRQDPASSSGGCTLRSLVHIPIVIPHWTELAKFKTFLVSFVLCNTMPLRANRVLIFYYISWHVIHELLTKQIMHVELIHIYMNIEMVHQYILLVTDAYLVGRNEMFSKMNIKILIQWLHKT